MCYLITSAVYKTSPLFTQEPTCVFWVALHLALMLTISSTEGLPWDPAIPRSISGRLMQRKEGVWKRLKVRGGMQCTGTLQRGEGGTKQSGAVASATDVKDNCRKSVLLS